MAIRSDFIELRMMYDIINSTIQNIASDRKKGDETPINYAPLSDHKFTPLGDVIYVYPFKIKCTVNSTVTQAHLY